MQKILYLLCVFLINFRMGVYLILMPWAAVNLDNSISLVGQLFWVSSFIGFFSAPYLGYVSDRCNGRIILSFGTSLILLSSSIPFLRDKIGVQFEIESFYLIVILFITGNIVSLLQIDSIYKALYVNSRQKEMRTKIGTLQQISLMFGTLFSGWSISLIGIKSTFLLIIIPSLLMLMIVPFFNYLKVKDSDIFIQGTSLIKPFSGLLLFKKPSLKYATLGCALVMTCSQLVNIAIPYIIQENIRIDSLLYGVVESSWALGGIITSLMLTYVLRFKYLVNIEYYALITLALATIAIAFINSDLFLISLFFLMGSAFSVSRILLDSTILSNSPPDFIGKAKGVLSSLVSFSGMFVYACPTLFSFSSMTSILIIFGAIISLMAGGLFMMHRRAPIVCGK